jgi:hypothetical protein
MLIDHLLQIKNIISTAHTLASRKGYRVTITYLEVANTAGEDFQSDLRGVVKLAIWALMCSCALALAMSGLPYICTHSLFGTGRKTG